MSNFVKTIIKHLIIFSLLSLGMLLVIFVMGFFTTLHPNAYIDGFMSIVYVYVIILIAHFIIYLIKITTNFDTFTLPKRVFDWYKTTGIFVNIALLFTVITVVNSIMMITGIDTPKTGSFAYLHLLVRTLIVVIAVVVTMYQEVLQRFKDLQFYLKLSKDEKRHLRQTKLNSVRRNLSKRPFENSAMLFTIITVLGCLFMILFSPLLNPSGGYNLYLSLVVFYGFTLLISCSYSLATTIKPKV